MSSNPLDFEQLKTVSKAEVQQKITALGADWHPSETKPDLIARLLQLQGTAQPIDKLRKELAKHGIGDTAEVNAAAKLASKRLTTDQMRKAMAKYIKKGMEFRVSKDGENWMMRFKCEQATYDGDGKSKIVVATRRDSGNTLIPIAVLQRCAEILTTYTPPRRRKNVEVDDNLDGFDEVAA